jgi:hypothetical protein
VASADWDADERGLNGFSRIHSKSRLGVRLAISAASPSAIIRQIRENPRPILGLCAPLYPGGRSLTGDD